MFRLEVQQNVALERDFQIIHAPTLAFLITEIVINNEHNYNTAYVTYDNGSARITSHISFSTAD